MNRFLKLLITTSLFGLLALPALALAEEPENLAADARMAPGDPPTIPHAVGDADDGEACLTCHRKGIKGASMVSHPERIGCTQCHVPGELKKTKAGGKKAKNKK